MMVKFRKPRIIRDAEKYHDSLAGGAGYCLSSTFEFLPLLR